MFSSDITSTHTTSIIQNLYVVYWMLFKAECVLISRYISVCVTVSIENSWLFYYVQNLSKCLMTECLKLYILIRKPE